MLKQQPAYINFQTQEDWETSGMLYGLNLVDKVLITKRLNEINDLIKSKNFDYDSCQFFPPAVRRVINHISGEDPYLYFFKNKDKVSEALKRVSVKDLCEQIDSCYFLLLPIMKKHLEFIDIEAEMLCLICSNYVFGIIKQLKTEEGES